MTRPPSNRADIARSLATRHPRAPLAGDVRLTIVLPAFREDRIGDSVVRVREELGHLDGGIEVVVVDDGSGDDTAARARKAGADQVVELAVNRGKGGAVGAGVAVATGRVVAFTDADLSYGPAQLERMVLEIEDGWDVVIGNRHHDDTQTVVRPSVLRAVGGRVVNGATRLALVGGHADTQGGIKAFRADVAKILFTNLSIDGFAFDVELLHLAERGGLSVREIPVTVENSERSTVNVARDAARLIGDLVAIRRNGSAGRYDTAISALRALAQTAPQEPAGPGR